MTESTLPPGWALSTLGEVAQLEMGQSPPGDATNEQGDGVPLLGGASDLPPGGSPRVSRYTTAPTKMCAAGDVLLCIRATIGRPTVSDGDYCVGRGLAALRAVGVERDWLVYFLRQAEMALNDVSSGSTFVSISRAELASLPIPVPPVGEQRRIVAKLDEVLASGRAARAALDGVPALLEQYRQAVLAAAFRGDLTSGWREQNGKSAASWQHLSLGDVSIRVTDGTHQPPPLADSGIPFITIGNIVGTRLEWSRVSKWVTPKTHKALTARCLPERGDVLYTAVGATFGRAVFVDWDHHFVFQRHIAHIKPRPDIVDPEYLTIVLNAPMTYLHACRVARGAAQPTVTLGDLRRFTIPVPPLVEQREIVRRINLQLRAIEGLEQNVVSTSAELAIMERAALAKAFRGELVPQLPTDEPASALLDQLRSTRGTAAAGRRPGRTMVKT
jgi:type I restriction enzyme, S subunit